MSRSHLWPVIKAGSEASQAAEPQLLTLPVLHPAPWPVSVCLVLPTGSLRTAQLAQVPFPGAAPRTMESLSELQNPLLPRSPAHLHHPYPYPEASPSWSCQEKLYSFLLGGADPARAHQLLDPGSLQLAVEAWYRPSCLLGRDKVKEPRAGSCETSFTESREPQAGPTEWSTDPGQAEEDVAIQTVSYGVQEELQGQDNDQEEEEVGMCI